MIKIFSLLILFFSSSFTLKEFLDYSISNEQKKTYYAANPNKILTRFLLLNKNLAISQYYQFKMLAHISDFNIPFNECSHCESLGNNNSHMEHFHDSVNETMINIVQKYMLQNINEFFDVKKFYQYFELSIEFDIKNETAKELGMNLSQNAEMIKYCIDAFSSVFSKKPVWDFAFYNGWLYYYYLKDYEKARTWLEKALTFKNIPPTVYNLYNTSFYLENRYDEAIKTTEQQIKNNVNPNLERKLLEKLEWFSKLSMLAKSTVLYKNKYNKMPNDLNDLVNSGIIKEIPSDPIGDGFYFDTLKNEPKSKNNPFEYFNEKMPLKVDKIKVGSFTNMEESHHLHHN